MPSDPAAALRRWQDSRPDLSGSVELWREAGTPVAALGIEAAIEAALAPRMTLPGGGEILFEPGETLTAIDVNSRGFAGKPGSAADELNFLAAAEIARQLRLRALAGTIVIDTSSKFLYLVEGNGQARRSGVGVGKEGFAAVARPLHRAAERALERRDQVARLLGPGPVERV